jgi:adenylate cyclase
MEQSEGGPVQRRLAAILAADVAGYSRLMGLEEEGTLAALKAHRRAVVDPKIAEHRGRIVKTTGDGILAEFASVVDAVRCAVEIQRGMAERNAGAPAERRIVFRMGINVGDIIIDGGDIFGDGVNVAARLEALADPGDIWVSRVVRDQVRDKLAVAFEDMGERAVKNIARPVKAHRVRYDGAPPPGGARQGAATGAARHDAQRHAPSRRRALAAVALLAVVVAAVAWLSLRPGTAPKGPDPAARASIAVLPFANLSADPKQEYFSAGITEDILTALARVPGLFVSSRNSSDRYKGASVDYQKVGRELGVRYALEGSVQKVGDQLRVTARLIEIANGVQVWAQRYDRPLADVFAVRDEITEAIATRLVAEIKQQELAIAKRKPTERMDAYDLVLQGRELLKRNGREPAAGARLLFEQAIARDPQYADAYAGLSNVYSRYYIFDYGEITGPPALDKSIELGERSLVLDPTNPFGAFTLALGYIFRGRLDDAEAVLKRAHDSYPHDADVMDRLGVTYVFQGRPREGLDLLLRVLKVDPFHRRQIHALIARAHVMLKDYEQAGESLKRCFAEAATYRVCYEVAAVYYVETGQIEKAREAVATLRRLHPAFTLAIAPSMLPFKRKADQDRFLEAFRKAGMPE